MCIFFLYLFVNTEEKEKAKKKNTYNMTITTAR